MRAVESVAQRSGALYTAPGPSPEAVVARLYAEIFGVDVAAVTDTTSFLDLGGTSLDVMKLKRRLERALDLEDVPVATVLQNPTVRALAASCVPRIEKRGYDPVVPLQTRGVRTPLFCVHAQTGEVLGFLRLAEYFADDRPLYALRARGFDAGESCFSSVAEIAQTYVEAIRAHRPHGPYAIAGYSYGALIAFEMTKLLESRGERVSFLASIDMPPALMYSTNPVDCAINLALLLSVIDKRQAEGLLAVAASVRPRDVCAQILRIARPDRVAKLGLDRKRLESWAAVEYSLLRAASTYTPSGTVESVTVFHAHPSHCTKQQWLQNELRLWDGYARMPNRYVGVPGEHFTLMGPRHVTRFQSLLRSEIAHSLRGH
jgi:thioesterase domain-containing protein